LRPTDLTAVAEGLVGARIRGDAADVLLLGRAVVTGLSVLRGLLLLLPAAHRSGWGPLDLRPVELLPVVIHGESTGEVLAPLPPPTEAVLALGRRPLEVALIIDVEVVGSALLGGWHQVPTMSR